MSATASPTKGVVNEFFLGDHNPQLVMIPHHVWHGFKNIADAESLIVNITTHPYQYDRPDEYRIDPHQNHIPYRWDRKDG